jgi:hypothetical protein
MRPQRDGGESSGPRDRIRCRSEPPWWSCNSLPRNGSVTVGTALRAAPRTDPGVRGYRTRLPPPVPAAKRSAGKGASHVSWRKPSPVQEIDPRPAHPPARDRDHQRVQRVVKRPPRPEPVAVARVTPHGPAHWTPLARPGFCGSMARPARVPTGASPRPRGTSTHGSGSPWVANPSVKSSSILPLRAGSSRRFPKTKRDHCQPFSHVPWLSQITTGSPALLFFRPYSTNPDWSASRR